MFLIQVYCEDNKLAKVLHAVTGLVIGQPTIQPVVNAASKNGKVEAASDATSVFDLFVQHLETLDSDKHIMAADVRRFLHGIGRKESAATYLLQKAQKHKLLKKHGKGTGMNYTRI